MTIKEEEMFKKLGLEVRELRSQLRKERIKKKKAITYMKNYIKVEDAPINDRIKIEFEEVIKILDKGVE